MTKLLLISGRPAKNVYATTTEVVDLASTTTSCPMPSPSTDFPKERQLAIKFSFGDEPVNCGGYPSEAANIFC